MYTGNIISTYPFVESSLTQRLREAGGASVEESLAKAITLIIISSRVYGMLRVREKNLATPAGTYVNAATEYASSRANAPAKPSKRFYL